ncbi:MAG: isochorismatase family protein [Candidatus Dormibacteria bacterium]
MGSSFNRQTALVVVDVQNDFADPRGKLFVPGGERVADLVRDLMLEAVGQGALVACSQDWHPPKTPHFQDQGGVWPTHCVENTWGAELHPSLPPAPMVVRKGQGQADGYSAFGARSLESGKVIATPLAELLLRGRITAVYVAGLALDVCVKATVLDSIALGLATSLIADATAAVNLKPGDGEGAIAEMRARGATIV